MYGSFSYHNEMSYARDIDRHESVTVIRTIEWRFKQNQYITVYVLLSYLILWIFSEPSSCVTLRRKNYEDEDKEKDGNGRFRICNRTVG